MNTQTIKRYWNVISVVNVKSIIITTFCYTILYFCKLYLKLNFLAKVLSKLNDITAQHLTTGQFGSRVVQMLLGPRGMLYHSVNFDFLETNDDESVSS